MPPTLWRNSFNVREDTNVGETALETFVETQTLAGHESWYDRDIGIVKNTKVGIKKHSNLGIE